MTEITISQHFPQAIEKIGSRVGQIPGMRISERAVTLCAESIQALKQDTLLLELLRLFYQDYITALADLQNMQEKIHKNGGKVDESIRSQWESLRDERREHVERVKSQWKWFASHFLDIFHLPGYESVAQQIAEADKVLAGNLKNFEKKAES